MRVKTGEICSLNFRPTDESFATKAIHEGSEPEKWNSKAVAPPITLASTFKQEEPGKYEFEYGRTGNPSRQVLEECLAVLEGGKHALCYASGQGAITTVASLLSAGDHILCVENVYGGTQKLFKEVIPRMNIETTFLDGTDAIKFCSGIKSNTKMVWMESVTNPLLKVIDVKRISSMVHSYSEDIIIVVDNTFLSPYFLKPLELGVDIVVHSITKYINGHSDVIMGAVIVNDEDIYKQLKLLQSTCGAVPSPFDCYLATRGLKTLQVRMDQHMKNGLAVAKFLESHPLVEKVIFPGLPSHPQHELAKHTWSGCSGMCSMYIKGGIKESKIFLKNLKIFALGVSLGGYESLVSIPLLMAYVPDSKSEQEKSEITDNFIRLSIGLESAEDLIEDLDQALKATTIKTISEDQMQELMSSAIKTTAKDHIQEMNHALRSMTVKSTPEEFNHILRSPTMKISSEKHSQEWRSTTVKTMKLKGDWKKPE